MSTAALATGAWSAAALLVLKSTLVLGALDRTGAAAGGQGAEAREREPDAVRIAEQLVDLDQVITPVGDAVAEGGSESR